MFLPAKQTVSTAQFTHDKKDREFIAEISDLGLNSFQQLYDDAADEGLVLVSEKSKKETRWAVESIHRSDDGEELQFWTLVPVPESVRAFPELGGYKMILFND